MEYNPMAQEQYRQELARYIVAYLNEEIDRHTAFSFSIEDLGLDAEIVADSIAAFVGGARQ